MAPLQISIAGSLQSEDLLQSTFRLLQADSKDDAQPEEPPRKRPKLEPSSSGEDYVPVAAVDFQLRLPAGVQLLNATDAIPFKYSIQDGVIELRNIPEKNRIVGAITPESGMNSLLPLIFGVQTKLASCKSLKSYAVYLEARG
jgi:hypothetical protein